MPPWPAALFLKSISWDIGSLAKASDAKARLSARPSANAAAEIPNARRGLTVMMNLFPPARIKERCTAPDGSDDSPTALVTVRIQKKCPARNPWRKSLALRRFFRPHCGALSPPPKMTVFEGPVEASQEVGSQAVGKIERRDHGAQKTGKTPGKKKSLLGVGHGPSLICSRTTPASPRILRSSYAN
jgi:hypothetical protein